MNPLLRNAIRTKFLLTSRRSATAQIVMEKGLTLAVVDRMGPEKAAQSCRVPKMPGVDEEMRDWSVLQILEHNLIVNRAYARLIREVGEGREYRFQGDSKKDVLPSDSPGMEVVGKFARSVDDYLAAVERFTDLRGVGSNEHPVFGNLDAHKSHCMFGFHLFIHRRQAEAVERRLRGE